MAIKLSNEIKMVVSDFDGVFTDGSVYISEKNEVQKKLNFKDIMGVFLLINKGIRCFKFYSHKRTKSTVAFFGCYFY